MLRSIHPGVPRGAAAVLALLTTVACISDSRAQDPWGNWSTLHMRAKAGALISGKVELHDTVSEGKRLFVTRTTARFLGATVSDTLTETTIDTRTGRTELYTSRTKKGGRRYIFDDERFVVQRLSPTKGPDAPLDEWEVTSTSTFPYPEDDQGNAVPVFDYYGMLLHLRETGLDAVGDEIKVHVASSKGTLAYRVIVAETRETERKFEDLKRMEERVLPVRELRLRIVPADPESAVGFLKMKGETELWVEAGSKTILDVSGRSPKIPGRIEIRLAAMG